MFISKQNCKKQSSTNHMIENIDCDYGWFIDLDEIENIK
jgi:hypothetical protein